ncbi:MAG: ABC transporter permease subunit [Streptosporangiales bacterium]|nr:ABC transporter permease subunit [Streptosporangiales bacterium]
MSGPLIRTYRMNGPFIGRGRRALPYLLLLPSVALLLAFFAAPFVSLFYFALRRLDLTGVSRFVGLDNFGILFGEARFAQNLLATLEYLVGVLVLSLPVAYVAAILVSRAVRGMSLLRTVLLIPWVLAPVVTAVLFRTLVDPSRGPVTRLLELVTGGSASLIQQPAGAMIVVILHSAWRSVPIAMLILAVGISAIPRELHEAARIDGGGRWAEFRHVILPLTRPHLISASIVISVFTLHDAEGVYSLTQGGPGYGTEVAAVRLFKEAFRYYDVGIGSAVGVALVVLAVVVLGIQFGMSRREEDLSR